MLMKALCLVRDERDAGNPVASLIKKLSLDKNKITIELPDWVEDGLGDADSDSDASEDTAAASPSPTVIVRSSPAFLGHTLNVIRIIHAASLDDACRSLWHG